MRPRRETHIVQRSAVINCLVNLIYCRNQTFWSNLWIESQSKILTLTLTLPLSTWHRDISTLTLDHSLHRLADWIDFCRLLRDDNANFDAADSIVAVRACPGGSQPFSALTGEEILHYWGSHVIKARPATLRLYTVHTPTGAAG